MNVFAKIARYGLWLFFCCSIAYSAWWVSRAVAVVMRRGVDHPGFWQSLIVLILVAAGVIVGGVVMFLWTLNEVANWKKRSPDK